MTDNNNNSTVKQLMEAMRIGKTGFAISQLNKSIDKASDTMEEDVNQINNPNYDNVNHSARDYNYDSGNQVFTKDILGYTQDNEVTNDRDAEYIDVINRYYSDQFNIKREFDNEFYKFTHGYYGRHGEANEYIQNLEEKVIATHRSNLYSLGLYESSLSEIELVRFNQLMVERQVQMMESLQTHLYSPQKKQFIATMNAIQQRIQYVQSQMRLHSPEDESYGRLNYELMGLVNEDNNLRQNYNGFMSYCKKGVHGGYTKEVRDQLHDISTNPNNYNGRYVYHNDGTVEYQMDGFLKSRGLVHANDDIYRRQFNGETYPGYKHNQDYRLSNNRLNPSNMNFNFRNMSRYYSLAAEKNKYVRQMRKMGYIPDSFGDPMSNYYVEQLIWVSPIPDPTYYDEVSEPPMWFLTPDELGYNNIVEANQHIIRDGLEDDDIKVHYLPNMTEEEKEELFNRLEREREEKEEIKKEDAMLVFYTDGRPPTTKYRARIKKEEEERLKKEEEERRANDPTVFFEENEPDFTSSEYVKGLEAIRYLPKIVVDYMGSKRFRKAEDLYDFCPEGIIFFHKYSQFAPYLNEDKINNALRHKLEELEMQLVDYKVEYETKREMEIAKKAATVVKKDMHLDNIDILDIDSINNLKDVAMSKVDKAFKIPANSIPDEYFMEKKKKYNEVKPFPELDLDKPLDDGCIFQYSEVDNEVEEEDEYPGFDFDKDRLFNEVFFNDIDEYGPEEKNPNVLTYYDYLKEQYDKLSSKTKSVISEEDLTRPNMLETVLEYIEELHRSNKTYVQNGKMCYNGVPYRDATEEEINTYRNEVASTFECFSDKSTITDTFEKLDITRIQREIDELRQTLTKNIKGSQFDAWSPIEKYMYINEVINGGILNDIDKDKLEPGLHKFYTSDGIYILDNRDLHVVDGVDMLHTSPDVRSQYMGNDRKYIDGVELYVNKLILPTIKPEQKEIYSKYTMSREEYLNKYITDIEKVKTREEYELFEWARHNAHPLYTATPEEIDNFVQYTNFVEDFKKYTGVDLRYESMDMDLDEWMERMLPYQMEMQRRGNRSARALQIYDVISEYDYVNTGYDQECQNMILRNVPPYMGGVRRYREDIHELRKNNKYHSNINTFRNRLGYTCHHFSKNKCNTTYNSGRVEVGFKLPPIQYSGKGTLFE